MTNVKPLSETWFITPLCSATTSHIFICRDAWINKTCGTGTPEKFISSTCTQNVLEFVVYYSELALFFDENDRAVTVNSDISRQLRSCFFPQTWRSGCEECVVPTRRHGSHGTNINDSCANISSNIPFLWGEILSG